VLTLKTLRDARIFMSKVALRSCGISITIVVVILCCSAISQGQISSEQVSAQANDSRPLNMLVLGDSIMWGQGLPREQKFWWRVKGWLREKTGREVLEKIEAHSGAVIGTPEGQPKYFTSNDAEVNLETPTINEQIDDAVKYYADPSNVDLILVNGCINDVDVHNLLNASTALEPLGRDIQAKCGGRMQALLGRITTAFPNAHLVVTGYYKIFSQQTANNSFTRLAVKKLSSPNPEARKMTDQQMRENLIAISEEWYRFSTRSLAGAVNAANLELQRSSSKQKILFAEIDFSPEHAFSAPDTLLWNFMFGSTNLSGLRKAIVILTFGTAAYKTNDPLRESRAKSCKQTFGHPLDKKSETEEEKKRREGLDLACRYASLGHPNKMGALVYTEAIKGPLHWLVSSPAWLRKPSAPQTAPAN
jgi:hypothetical protein